MVKAAEILVPACDDAQGVTQWQWRISYPESSISQLPSKG
jgi:hypothetical protein